MLRKKTIRKAFRFTIYLLFTFVFFKSLNIFYNPETSLDTTRCFLTTFRNAWGRDYRYPSKEVQENLFLNTRQCLDAFPGFDKEVRDAVQRGPFVLRRVKDNSLGPSVQGRIKDGKLYIISAERDLSQAAKQYRDAVLHQLHRAIITTPTNEPLPDTIFSFNVQDNPRENTWSFSRSNDFTTYPNQWLMPHFSYWSWPQYHFIQSLDTALKKIQNIENEYSDSLESEEMAGSSWLKKIDKVVWRGTAWYNPISNTNLRQSLIRATKNKDWADVKPLKWNGKLGEAENILEIEEFCRYRYVVYTEGITYSGRLPFHQICASVLISPPIGFWQHTSFLIKPIFSDMLRDTAGNTTRTSEAWPTSFPVDVANFVFVQNSWEDLEDTVLYFREHPSIAERIARNQRDLMVKGGYLSTAAETCYWRALVRGWSDMARLDESWGGEELGMRWEVFSLTGNVRYE